MFSAIESQLNETYRDALVEYYLSEVVPNHLPIKQMALDTRLKTANDLYEFLLLDTQVSQGVETSYVASAISSLQQYINGVLMGMEPGYSEQVLNANQLAEWRDQRSQYPIWAANQKLLYYPELYIDPSLRLKKSGYFKQLETDINQNKIEVDTVQDAVKAYLASFEEVANLSIINGYIDSNDFATGTYYFIGKSRAEDQYYWRSVNMNDRAYLSGMDGPKSDYPNPGAWTDWKKANIGVTPNTLERTIRPVFFNNRLFITWLDYVVLDDAVADGEAGKLTQAGHAKLTLYASYKKYDDSWSAPIVYIEDSPLPSALGTDTNTIAVFDNSRSPESLFLAVYSKAITGGFSYWKVITVDKNFNKTVASLEGPVLIINDIFSKQNKDRFQFQVDSSLQVLNVTNIATPQTDDFNYEGLAESVRDAQATDFSFMQGDSSLRARLKADSAVKNSLISLAVMLIVQMEGSPAQNLMVMVLNTGELESVDDEVRIPLVVGSHLYSPYAGGNFFTKFGLHFTPLFLKDKDDTDGVMIDIPAEGLVASLEGLYLKRGDMISLLLNSPLLVLVVNRAGDIIYVRDRVVEPYVNFVRSVVKYPTNMNAPNTLPLNTLQAGAWVELVSEGSYLDTSIKIDQESAYPVWDVTPASDGYFYLYYGVEFGGEDFIQGAALKCAKIKLERSPPSADAYTAPSIGIARNPGLGNAEFINFVGSTIAKSDDNIGDRKPIRMNTLFARELVQKANLSLEALLSWQTQQLDEPQLPAERLSKMDFHGANGLYFWGLFFHLPLMIAQRLNLERQFNESERWLAFIFDPGRKADNSGRPNYWNVRPLEEPSTRDYAMRSPVDPDGQASSNPQIYKKATYRYYIKNLIDRGDSAYRQLTPDSLNEAKLWYVRVLDLLGPRPDGALVNDWAPVSLENLQASTNQNLRDFEHALLGQDTPTRASATRGMPFFRSKQPPLYLSTFVADPMLAEVDNAHFRVPLNAELVMHWDTVDSRLYNLRHNLSLDGKPLALPLFAAPLDPRAMLAAFANGGGAGALTTLFDSDIPHFRFSFMHNHASAAVETLVQFGGTLLSLIERKEQSELQELQQQQMWDFALFGIELQEQSQRLEAESREALLTSRRITDARALFYGQLADHGVSDGERSASALHANERVLLAASGVSAAIAQGMKLPPNIFGLASGGMRYEGVAGAVSVAATAVGTVLGISGDILERSEAFRRRQQEWENLRDQARLESAQIDAQLKVIDEQNRLTAIQLRQAKIAFEQARINYEFLGKRFSQSQLYQWLNGQMSSLYYQAYDATLSLCLAAQASWQFDRADFSTRFIRPSAWNDSYRGLLAGESLKLDLLKMNAAYLARHERLLEIVKTVSVRQLPPSSDDAPSINVDWDTAVARLADDGVVEFELTQAMFDADYPNHYLRRIKRISVSLPVTVGPYQDIRAILTQSYSAVHLSAGAEVSPRENLRASQQIAVSTGVDDDGLFVFNFDDERYLPFEGTGAISRWRLEFPNPEAQRDMIDSITDIIVHIRYTAKSGGSVMSRAVSVTRGRKPGSKKV